MIVIFGKGKVGKGLEKLLNKLKIKNIVMDDSDFDEKKLKTADKIIVSPGIKQDHKIYKKFGKKTYSELNFLGDIISNNKIFDKKLEFIGVTGTNGKSTSVHIMYNMFKGLFEKLKIQKDVHLSGNFGTPLSETLCEIIDKNQNESETKHLIILEASSFMLYKLNNFTFDYSILTNLGIDHLDRHKDLDEYFDSKFNIIKYTKIYSTTNQDCISKYEVRLSDTDTKIFKDTRIEPYENSFDLSKTQFLGEHNKGNRNAIYKLIWEYFDNNKITRNDEIFWSVAKTIEPLDHRIKLVKEITIKGSENKIKIYDDGICTSSAALNAALSCFNKKVVLIAGGFDKGEDYSWLGDEFEKKVGFACLIGETAKKFSKVFDERSIDYKIFDNLNDAVLYSTNVAKELKLENILFSPGSASFDMFKNVYDRCEQFGKIISKIDNL